MNLQFFILLENLSRFVLKYVLLIHVCSMRRLKKYLAKSSNLRPEEKWKNLRKGKNIAKDRGRWKVTSCHMSPIERSGLGSPVKSLQFTESCFS